MSRLAVDKARDIHRRYPDLSFPVDMEWLASAEGCELLNWPFMEPVKEVKQGRWIGIATGLEEREQRYLIAHALAHHLMHRGNQLSFRDWQKGNILKQERGADECAAHILMPEPELTRIGNIPVWELADYFGVPDELARQRVTKFATDEELARWQMTGKGEPPG